MRHSCSAPAALLPRCEPLLRRSCGTPSRSSGAHAALQRRSGAALRRSSQLNREAWGRLGPLAANLNQWIKAIHEGRAAGAPLRLVEQLRAAVSDLRQALLGRTEPPA
jgi:hypothetical protein